MAATGIAVTLGGCLDGGIDGEGPADEPDELPPGLAEDGIQVHVLRGMVLEAVEGSYRAGGAIQERENGEVVESEGESVAANADRERGIHVRARESGPIDSTELRDAADVRVTYFDGEESFRGPDDPRIIDSGFEDLTEQVQRRWVDEVFEIVAEVVWGTPEWDADAGLYVVPAVEFTDEFENVTILDGELRVTRDGVPVYVGGRIEERDDEADLEVTLDTSDVSVPEPEWVAAAEPPDEPSRNGNDDQVPAKVEVVAVSGTVGESGVLEAIQLVTQIAPGSDPVDLGEAVLQFRTQSVTATLTHGAASDDDFDPDTLSAGTFGTVAIQGDDAEVLESRTDRIRIVFDSGGLQSGDVAEVTISPQQGRATAVMLTVPDLDGRQGEIVRL